MVANSAPNPKFVLQIGLMAALHRVRWSLLATLSYLALSLAFHTVSLQQWWEEDAVQLTDPLLAFYAIHRICKT